MDQPWKMLVYISADNTLYNDALVSLRQITDASLLNNVDIIVQLDGPDPDQVSRYRCVGGQKQLLWEAPNGYTLDRAARLQHFLGLLQVLAKRGQGLRSACQSWSDQCGRRRDALLGA